MSAPIVSAKGPRPRRDSHTLAGSDVVGRHLNFNFDKKKWKNAVFCVLGGKAYLQGFGAFSQQLLDVPSRRHHQLLCIVGLHGEVRTVFMIHLRQRGVRGHCGRSKRLPFRPNPSSRPDRVYPDCICPLRQCMVNTRLQAKPQRRLRNRAVALPRIHAGQRNNKVKCQLDKCQLGGIWLSRRGAGVERTSSHRHPNA